MIGEVNVGGVFLSSVLVTALIALCLNFLLRRLLAWTGVYRLVWHPALFDTALFFVLWGAVSQLPLSL
jgi:protein-S-isoprenylcysteine O-methyltransferase Ste14